MKNNPYQSFSNFVLRAPLLSMSSYKELTSMKSVSDETFKDLFNNPIIKETLFIASPPLYKELEKWTENKIKDSKRIEKLRYSFLKYISRMSSRCTPFGLFAGCAVGEFGDKTEITLGTAKKNKRHTRLDMNYLVALAQDLAKEKTIKEQLLYYPNSSIYIVGDQIRFVEYRYIEGKRHHNIVAVDNTEYLARILETSKKGCLLSNLSAMMVDDEISMETASDFVEELVSSQILISELEPSISGPEFLEQICQTLQGLDKTEKIVHILKDVNDKLFEIDLSIGNVTEKYIEITQVLKKLKTGFDIKFLFQTDLVLKPQNNILDSALINSVKECLSLFNKITLPPKETFMNRFKDAFQERFEEREIELSKALDVEMGIGYRQNEGSQDVNPLIDDISLPNIKNGDSSLSDIKWSLIDSIFHKKLTHAFANKDYSIVISDDDFKNFKKNWRDLPDTISTMIEVVKIDGKVKIIMNSAGGSSGATLFGRFCHGDERIGKHAKNIIDLESKMNNDKILAEIVHLPESRVGNILMRPFLRNYEIPYLGRSVKRTRNQIPINDLYISVNHDRLVSLKSKKHNKIVLPRLTNAHNFSTNSLPIYHFMGDMQTQGKRRFIGVNLGPFAGDYDFVPRIEYKSMILSEAFWNVKIADIKFLLEFLNEDRKLLSEFRLFRNNRNIPQYVLLADDDNKLLVNFENCVSLKMLLETVKKRQSFKLIEFLFSEEGIVKNKKGEEYWTNQIVLSFYNSEKI